MSVFYLFAVGVLVVGGMYAAVRIAGGNGVDE